MIHNQFCQSSSRPHIPHHFKWPSSIFQVAENVCHEIIRGSFHCKIRKSEGVIFSSLVQKILMESPEPEVRYIAPFSEAEPEPWTPSLSWIHCSWCSINLSDGRSSSQISQSRETMLLSSLSVSILSCVRTISRNTPLISSTTRGIWESSVSPRRWHSHWWASSSSSHNWSYSD